MKKSTARQSLKLLGSSGARFPSQPDARTLEVFPNRSPERDYCIAFHSSEFTSLCPVTGQPDFANLRIRYIPDAVCLETKSLKFYLSSFRSTPSFGEAIANRILDDLVSVLAPRRIEVVAEFSPRGGIQLIVEARHPDKTF